MNIRRGDTSKVVVTGRQVSGETHYLCVFQRVDLPSFYQYCIAENIGSTSGPLLLEVIETDSATATDGEVTLGVGDWNLTVYGQDNGTNLDAANSDRTVWNELLTVDSDTTQTPSYPPEGGGSGSAPDADRCRYIRVCGDPTDGQVVTYDATADRWEAADPTGGVGGGTSDHGALTGLADDDHTQYLNNTRGDVRYYTKSQVDTSLSGKANTSHTHAISDTTGLQTALDGKQAAGSYAAASHGHAISDVTGLQTALDGKQAAGTYATGTGSASGTNTGDQDLSGLAVKSNNLSDLTSASTARTNLGLGTLATQSGTFSGTSSGTNTGDQTNISGNAATVTTNANLTGPITSVGNATTIAAGVVTPLMLSTATQTPTPTTGQTQTFNTSSNSELIACLHSSTIAAQTFVIPTNANSAIGQELSIFSRAAITTVTLTQNGNTIYGAAFTTIAAAGVWRFRKIAASTWVRL